MNKFLKAALPAAIALGLVACGGSSNDDNTVSMRLSDIQNLEPLQNGFEYEGWIIVDGAPVTTGRFNVEVEDGQIVTVPAEFDLDLTQANASELFVLTIEPPVETDDPAPADTHILAGPIAGGVSNIVTDHPAAIDTDFASAAGTFILATPTNGNETPAQGIWYLAPGEAGPTPSLTLPTLPAGWVYEGWVVDSNGPVSTGTFLGAAGADSDGAGPTAGPLDGPPFPGQDFITPPVDLTGQTAVISVEPFPDDSPAPFVMKPLIAPNLQVPGGTLGNEAAATLPSATVTIDL